MKVFATPIQIKQPKRFPNFFLCRRSERGRGSQQLQYRAFNSRWTFNPLLRYDM